MNEGADHPGVVAPPPLIFIGFLLVGWGLGRLFGAPGLPLESTLRGVLTGAFVTAGLLLILWAGGLFRKAGTNMRPWAPSTALVVEGPYRFTRNPMYLGFALIYAGLAVGLDSVVALILLIPCVLVMNWGVIGREERYLSGKFGEPYADYRRAVRPWL
ncbi:MAG TPA: isoprenylcysteine carboxylmethyltransferase family protein [Caulobacteraceae bacterium]